MSNAENILNDLSQAICLSRAEIVLAENLDAAMSKVQKRRAIDLLLSFRSRLEAAALDIGRDIYEVPVKKFARGKTGERRGKYAAKDFVVTQPTSRGLSADPHGADNR